MSAAPIIAELGLIEFINGVNPDHDGFVTVRAVSGDANISLVGQMSPAHTRQHGLDAIRAAVHAEYEAKLMKVCHTFMSESAETANHLAGTLIALMRQEGQ